MGLPLNVRDPDYSDLTVGEDASTDSLAWSLVASAHHPGPAAFPLVDLLCSPAAVVGDEPAHRRHRIGDNSCKGSTYHT